MKDEQLLKKIIEKAVKGGYDLMKHDIADIDDIDFSDICNPEYEGLKIRGILFDHDLVKAYFGEELYYEEGDIFKTKKWEIYIQRMALSEDLLKYMERFLT